MTNKKEATRKDLVNLVTLIKDINKTLGIKGAITFDDPGNQKEANRPKRPKTNKIHIENKDIVKMERNKDLMQMNDERWKSIIDKFLVDQQLIMEPDHMLTMKQYMDHVKKDNKVAMENFLNPAQIMQFKNEMNSRTSFLFKNMKSRESNIWMPSRFAMSKDIRRMFEAKD